MFKFCRKLFCFCLNNLVKWALLFIQLLFRQSSILISATLYLWYIYIYILFDRYLSALISQSFLDIGSLSRILDSIMKLCLRFCWSIDNQESIANTSELEHITEVHLAYMTTSCHFLTLACLFTLYFSCWKFLDTWTS